MAAKSGRNGTLNSAVLFAMLALFAANLSHDSALRTFAHRTAHCFFRGFAFIFQEIALFCVSSTERLKLDAGVWR
jgi:hypothetical protein